FYRLLYSASRANLRKHLYPFFAWGGSSLNFCYALFTSCFIACLALAGFTEILFEGFQHPAGRTVASGFIIEESVIESSHGIVSPNQIHCLGMRGVAIALHTEKFTSTLYHKPAPQETLTQFQHVVFFERGA